MRVYTTEFDKQTNKSKSVQIWTHFVSLWICFFFFLLINTFTRRQNRTESKSNLITHRFLLNTTILTPPRQTKTTNKFPIRCNFWWPKFVPQWKLLMCSWTQSTQKKSTTKCIFAFTNWDTTQLSANQFVNRKLIEFRSDVNQCRMSIEFHYRINVLYVVEL